MGLKLFLHIESVMLYSNVKLFAVSSIRITVEYSNSDLVIILTHQNRTKFDPQFSLRIYKQLSYSNNTRYCNRTVVIRIIDSKFNYPHNNVISKSDAQFKV